MFGQVTGYTGTYFLFI